MDFFNWKALVQEFDERRDIIILDSKEQAIDFSAKQFIEIARTSIKKHKFFSVALSGGSTPLEIYKKLTDPSYISEIDWSKVFLFWSDERSVPPNHSENNFHMAMEAGLAKLPVLPHHIFRMEAEGDIEENAHKYEEEIIKIVPQNKFDLVMLGMGDDGHTASLFPHTRALHVKNKLVAANEVPQKKTWRMSLTFECINHAWNISEYVIGKNKAEMIAKVLKGPYNPDVLPAQKIGTNHQKVLWILDKEAASLL